MLNVKQKGFDKPLFANLTRFIDLLPDVLEEEALELGVAFEDNLEAIYATAPPRTSAKFVWSLDAAKNLKAMRWWYANLKKGNIPTDGKHYKRQGAPPYGGKILVERQGDRLVVIVTNTWSKAGLVFGQIGKDTRLPGHKATGWDYVDPKIRQLRKLYLEALFERVMTRRMKEGRL